MHSRPGVESEDRRVDRGGQAYRGETRDGRRPTVIVTHITHHRELSQSFTDMPQIVYCRSYPCVCDPCGEDL